MEVEGKWEWSGGRGPGELPHADADADADYRGGKLIGFMLKLETLVGGRRVCLSQSKKTVSSGWLSFTGAAGA